MNQKLEALSFRHRLYIHYGLCAAGSILMMAGSQGSDASILHPVVIIGIILLICGLVYRILYVKCPHCGDGLYQSHTGLKTCPDCGKDLNCPPNETEVFHEEK